MSFLGDLLQAVHYDHLSLCRLVLLFLSHECTSCIYGTFVPLCLRTSVPLFHMYLFYPSVSRPSFRTSLHRLNPHAATCSHFNRIYAVDGLVFLEASTDRGLKAREDELPGLGFPAAQARGAADENESSSAAPASVLGAAADAVRKRCCWSKMSLLINENSMNSNECSLCIPLGLCGPTSLVMAS